MRIALAQINPIVGDIAGNARRIIDAARDAQAAGAELVVTCELSLLGYPPRDLLLREGIVEACEAALREIAAACPEIAVIVGHPRRPGNDSGFLRNSASVCSGGAVVYTYDKRLLPGYDVFDEDRYFEPGDQMGLFTLHGRRIGLMICEDMWRADDVDQARNYASDPAAELCDADCDVLVTINASPFVIGKDERHVNRVRALAQRAGAPLIAVNEVGGNDDLIFDGRSIAVDAHGAVIARCRGWGTDLIVVDVASPDQTIDSIPFDDMDDLFGGLVLGLGDYVRKTGHTSVALGLSGGIDSALTATLAVAAIGRDNVRGVLMPSRYSSEGSIRDAIELAERLGIPTPSTVSIEDAHASTARAIAPTLGGTVEGIADENIQARLRGIILMAISNATPGCLVLSTSNKSESAVGYTTLYGDMCGALAPIADLIKTRVYEMSRWINEHHQACGFTVPPIPESSITKPPSAELRPDQTDQDSLPPYERLDAIIVRMIEQEQSVDRIVEETGFDEAEVRRFASLIDREQYKRDQASIVLKVTPRTFGRGRPMPMAMRLTGLTTDVDASPTRSSAHSVD